MESLTRLHLRTWRDTNNSVKPYEDASNPARTQLKYREVTLYSWTEARSSRRFGRASLRPRGRNGRLGWRFSPDVRDCVQLFRFLVSARVEFSLESEETQARSDVEPSAGRSQPLLCGVRASRPSHSARASCTSLDPRSLCFKHWKWPMQWLSLIMCCSV